VVVERIYGCLLGGSKLETFFMHGTISISDVWCMEWRIPWLACIFVLFSYIGEVLISVVIFVDNCDISWIIVIKFHLQKARLNNLFRSAVLFCVCEWGAMVCKCRPLVEDSSPANQGILYFIHHTSEINIVPYINNVSNLDPPFKQLYICYSTTYG